MTRGRGTTLIKSRDPEVSHQGERLLKRKILRKTKNLKMPLLNTKAISSIQTHSRVRLKVIAIQ